MNAIQIFPAQQLAAQLAAQAWVERLGWTLVHFLWEGFVIAAIYAAVRIGVRRPGVRYIAGCAALAAMGVMPAVTWSLLGPSAAAEAGVSYKTLVSAGAAAAVHIAPESLASGSYTRAPAPFLPWVVALWALGAMVFWMRLLGGWVYSRRLRSRRVWAAPGEWQQALDRLRDRIGVSRPVRLLVSALVESPAVVGWLCPVVLVPVGALAGFPPEQMEALLLHELGHVRRHDYCINVLQGVVEALLFYHPAVWWISGHIRAERELACDDVTLSLTGDAVSYARALAELEFASTGRMRVAMAASAGSLAHRIARLLGQPLPRHRGVFGSGVVVLTVLLSVTAFALFGQPKFEVASVKLSHEESVQTVRVLPGRLTADATVERLIQYAYGVQSFEMTGGPNWIRSERFAIEAKTDGPSRRPEGLQMLRSLLEDRFQLKTHRETREMPVFALVAARGGLKLPPVDAVGCRDTDADGLPAWVGGRMAPPVKGLTMIPECGVVGWRLETDGPLLLGGRVAMPELARALSNVMGRTVIDRTGYTGIFDVKLNFMADEATPLLPPPPPGSGVATGPSIFSALQQQLGLRLEATRGPAEMMVIDRVERPSAN
jgi:uncharacterized protein (TIGR03435 family)